jgi:TetR/AcrR family transcriptional repressor of nem operon
MDDGSRTMNAPPENSRTRLLAATIDLVRANGYSATRVDDVCAAAGVTKGSFFHHFASKEELAIAAAGAWNERASQVFAAARYHARPDPLDRLLGYVDYRKELLAGETWEFSCYAGTTIQETHESHPEIRGACANSIENHLKMLIGMIDAARDAYPVAGVSAASLATHMQAVIQGAFVMAKARQDKQAAIDAFDHLHRYLELLFGQTKRKR